MAKLYRLASLEVNLLRHEQGKSEGFDDSWTDLVIFLKLDSNFLFFRLYDLEIRWMYFINNRALPQCYIKLCPLFQRHQWIQTRVTAWKCSIRVIQCKPDISRLVGSMERYRDISGSAIYRATAMSQNPGQVFQRVVSGDGAFVCLAANSARRQRISWHLSKFDVALQNRVVEFRTKAVCA